MCWHVTCTAKPMVGRFRPYVLKSSLESQSSSAETTDLLGNT